MYGRAESRRHLLHVLHLVDDRMILLPAVLSRMETGIQVATL